MKYFLKIFLVFVIVILMSDIVFAIPAFARKYNMSCSTCHNPIPKLKAYGDDFAANGFVLADKDSPRYYVETGDEDLSLIRDLPLAIRMEGFVTYNNMNSERGDFSAPYLIKLLSGGAIAKDLSYYFYFFFNERGEVAGVEDAFLMFNNVLGSNLDLYVGQFQVSDPLFKRELRLTFEDYQIYKAAVGNSTMNLEYDRGIMMTYGFDTGTDIIVEVLNGGGIGAVNDFKIYDNDKYKSFFGRISQDVSDFLRIGASAYSGKEIQNRGDFDELTNSLTMFGPDFTLSYDDILELNVQYVQRTDDWEYSSKLIQNDKMETKGAFGELIWKPGGDLGKWYGVALFNWIESDQQDLNYKSFALHGGYLLKRNLRLVSEIKFDLLNEYTQFGLGFVTAF